MINHDKLNIKMMLVPLFLITVSGCKTTASVSASNGDVKVEAKVIVENESHNNLLNIFAPEIIKDGILSFSSIDASSLEFQINNIYNVTQIKNNELKISLTNYGKRVSTGIFSVYKNGSSYKLSNPSLFTNWAKPFENQADGFTINLTPQAIQMNNPSKFTISSKYKSYEFLETAPVSYDGCDLPEYPVPDPSEYCN